MKNFGEKRIICTIRHRGENKRRRKLKYEHEDNKRS